MNLKYRIRNFRVFDKDGAEFNLKPVTILTGANCSGKSSLVKSLMLIKDFINKMRDSHSSPEKTQLSFSDGSININGIKSVFNFNSKDSKDLVFTFSKSILSEDERIVMDLFFSEKEGDFFNDGWLNRIRFSCVLDGKTEVFLDVTYDSAGKMKVDTLDLSGNIYRLFCRNLDIATYGRLFDYCTRQKYNTRSAIDELDGQFNALIDAIKSNPLNDSLVLNDRIQNSLFDRILLNGGYERKREINSFSNELLTDGIEDMSCWNKFKESGLLMYLPILEEIGAFTSSELKEYFHKIEIKDELLDNYLLERFHDLYLGNDYVEGFQSEIFDSPNAYKLIFHKVLEDFSSSGFSTFGEYYRKLQSDALSKVGNLNDEGFEGGNWRELFYKDRFGASNDESGFLEKVSAFISMLTGLHYMEYYDYRDYPNSLLFRPKADYYMVYRVLTYLQRERSFTKKVKHYDDAMSPVYEFDKDDYIQWRDPRWSGLADIPESRVFALYRLFLINAIKVLYHCDDLYKVKSVGSFLCPVLRTYSLYDNDNPVSTALKSFVLLRNRIASINRNREKKYIPGTFIKKWVKELGIGRSIDIQLNDDSTGIHLFILDMNGRKVSSADYGHGVTQILYVLLNIENEIMQIELEPKNKRTICFEEPEVSLHPSWQSKLAHVVRDANSTYGLHFIIETHSEYFTRATQAMVATSCKTAKDLKEFPFVVYYMDNNGTAYDLEYTLSGRFKNSFGQGFYDEASRSSIEILKREKLLNKTR